MATTTPTPVCPDCRGAGQVADCIDGMRFYRPCRLCSSVPVCPRCQGAGHVRGETCESCEGSGTR